MEYKPKFITYINGSRDPRSILSPEEMLSNHSSLMMAGSETTVTLLSGCTYFLLKRPEVYSELVSYYPNPCH
jgi:cytochrome P450